MPIGILFWFLMILWAVCALGNTYRPAPYFAYGGTFLAWVLFALLGWSKFGPILQH